MASELEAQSGRAVLLFSREGELAAMGPGARRTLGLQGRVDPLRAADLPIEGLAAHLRGLASGKEAGPVAGLRLVAPEGPCALAGSFEPCDPGRGSLPAWFAFTASPPARAVRRDGTLSGMHLLLAEDSPENQLLIGYFLQGAGAEIEIVEDGAQAVERARHRRFDAVFLDMNMPVMDGFEAASRIRRSDATVPIVALTASAEPEVEQRCREAGCTHFATKPIKRRPFLELAMEATSAARAPAPIPDDDELRADPEFQALIAEFVRDLDLRLAAMRAAWDRQAWAELERLAHQLKGAAGGFGLPEISEVSSELETSARSAEQRAAAAGALDRLTELVSSAAQAATTP